MTSSLKAWVLVQTASDSFAFSRKCKIVKKNIVGCTSRDYCSAPDCKNNRVSAPTLFSHGCIGKTRERLASSPRGCRRCDAKYQAAAGTQAEPLLSLALRPSREAAHRQTDPTAVWAPGFPAALRVLLPRAVAGARAPPSFTTGQWRRGQSTAQLQSGPMVAQEGQRPAPLRTNGSVPRRPGRPSQARRRAGGR